MLDFVILWDLDDDPEGNVQHVAEHGFTKEEVEAVLTDFRSNTEISRSSGERVTFGYTPTGRHLAVVWQHVDDDPLTLRPITAYETPEPRKG